MARSDGTAVSIPFLTVPAHERSARYQDRRDRPAEAGAGQFGGFMTTVEVAAVIAAMRDALLCVPSGPPMT